MNDSDKAISDSVEASAFPSERRSGGQKGDQKGEKKRHHHDMSLGGAYIQFLKDSIDYENKTVLNF